MLSQKKYDEVIGRASKVPEKDPKNAQARMFLGTAYLAKGRVAEASNEFNKILAADPNSIPARLNLARLALRDDKREEALEQFRAVLKILRATSTRGWAPLASSPARASTSWPPRGFSRCWKTNRSRWVCS
jgi:cytochrome c-type biogenesis protein CcmH/NrfG